MPRLSYRSQEDHRPVADAQNRPMTEDIAVRGVDSIENASAARDRRADLQAHASGKAAPQRHSAREELARAPALEFHEPRPSLARACLRDIVLVPLEALQVLAGDIDPALR